MFRFSPSSIRKQFEDAHGSAVSPRHLVHHSQRFDASKQHNAHHDTSDHTPLTKNNIDITVPGTVSPNVVAPWEEQTLAITVPGTVSPNVVAPWEDIAVPGTVSPNVVAPWEDIAVPRTVSPNVVAS